MKLLKSGKVVNIWIGRCSHCGAVVEADICELQHVNDEDGDTYHTLCMDCGDHIIVFFRVDTREAKGILRKDNLKTIYPTGTK